MEKRKWYQWGRKQEVRQTLEEILINGYIPSDLITKDQAKNIPSLTACVDLIANTIASLPVCLYKQTGEKVEEMKDDPRLKLLNDETGDTLDAFCFKRALIEDYLLEGNGYAYINRRGNNIMSLHYIDKKFITIVNDIDPIFKTFDISVNGEPYQEFEFIKFLRHTKNGSTGYGIVSENNKVLSVAYNSLIYENTLVATGGNKKGFLKSLTRISSEAIQELKDAWKRLYANSSENIVVLNNGLEFQEASSTSIEMQMNENKRTNSDDICKMFLVPPTILDGTAKDEEYSNYVKNCISPIITAFETVLNKELLLNKEKGTYYFALDDTSLLKGDIEKRYKAYTEAVKSGWISKNEIRYLEDYERIEGLDIISFSLGEVIYDIEKKTFYTPNMDTVTNSEGQMVQDGNKMQGEKKVEKPNNEKPNEGEPTN